MKYIKTERLDGTKELFTFPRSVDHDCMVLALDGMRSCGWGDFVRVRRKPISAGFVNESGECYGRSETLNLPSDPEDTLILEKQM